MTTDQYDISGSVIRLLYIIAYMNLFPLILHQNCIHYVITYPVKLPLENNELNYLFIICMCLIGQNYPLLFKKSSIIVDVMKRFVRYFFVNSLQCRHYVTLCFIFYLEFLVTLQAVWFSLVCFCLFNFKSEGKPRLAKQHI